VVPDQLRAPEVAGHCDVGVPVVYGSGQRFAGVGFVDDPIALPVGVDGVGDGAVA
jgi:hypothetical protein